MIVWQIVLDSINATNESVKDSVNTNFSPPLTAVIPTTFKHEKNKM